MSDDQWPMPVAILAVLMLGAVIGVVNEIMFSKIGVNAFIATLGTGTIVVGLNYAYSAASRCSSRIRCRSRISASGGLQVFRTSSSSWSWSSSSSGSS